MDTKHSPAPWRIEQEERWPFSIEIVDANGETISRESRYAYGTGQETLDDVMNARGMRIKGDPEFADRCIEANARQMADVHLRAAAPEMLEALQMYLVEVPIDEVIERSEQCKAAARAAIAKALGE